MTSDDLDPPPAIGERIVTQSYGRVRGAAKYPCFQTAVCEVVRLASGQVVAQYKHHPGTARRSRLLALQDAQEYAKATGLRFIDSVRQWAPIGPQPPVKRPAKVVQGELFDGT